ncbi:uncharacterized protein RSE6_09702 [Rhynchosporium secalis]|uniref:Uncharacterized protein n=1 Tax=Rhynchosporium secalis TaxID=38038 RepID=A0A1E1MIN6_RHYSE|nr:uncharacterized protein RSE6_09702 [Rhynchosporium secalis]
MVGAAGSQKDSIVLNRWTSLDGMKEHELPKLFKANHILSSSQTPSLQATLVYQSRIRFKPQGDLGT